MKNQNRSTPGKNKFRTEWDLSDSTDARMQTAWQDQSWTPDGTDVHVWRSKHTGGCTIRSHDWIMKWNRLPQKCQALSKTPQGTKWPSKLGTSNQEQQHENQNKIVNNNTDEKTSIFTQGEGGRVFETDECLLEPKCNEALHWLKHKRNKYVKSSNT